MEDRYFPGHAKGRPVPYLSRWDEKELKYEEAQEFLATEERNAKSRVRLFQKLKDFAAGEAPPKELEEKAAGIEKYELYKSAVIEPPGR